MKYGFDKDVFAKEMDWHAVEERLKEEKRRTLPLTDTSEAIRRFRLSSQVVKESVSLRRNSGLVEQQACFTKLREQGS